MKFFDPTLRHGKSRGFTLIEMLVVVAIIVLLMALAVPSFFGTIQSNRLTAAGQNLLGRLSQAQQTASSTNIPVEVRFYQYTDSSTINTSNCFGAYQFLLVKTVVSTTTGAATESIEPLSSPFFIESGVYISANPTLRTDTGTGAASPLLTNGTGGMTFNDDGGANSGVPKQINKGPGTATYVAIRLFPDGTVKRLSSSASSPVGTDQLRSLTTLNLADAYVTLVGEKNVLNPNDSVTNYYAVQLDPYTGHARAYQPGL